MPKYYPGKTFKHKFGKNKEHYVEYLILCTSPVKDDYKNQYIYFVRAKLDDGRRYYEAREEEFFNDLEILI
jgi:hypothetical protein